MDVSHRRHFRIVTVKANREWHAAINDSYQSGHWNLGPAVDTIIGSSGRTSSPPCRRILAAYLHHHLPDHATVAAARFGQSISHMSRRDGSYIVAVAAVDARPPEVALVPASY